MIDALIKQNLLQQLEQNSDATSTQTDAMRMKRTGCFALARCKLVTAIALNFESLI